MTSVNELLDRYYGDVKEPNKISKALYAMAVLIELIGGPIVGTYLVYLYVKTLSALVR